MNYLTEQKRKKTIFPRNNNCRCTRGEKSSRTCRATRINLELKASKLSLWHIKGFPSKGVESSEQLG